MYVYFIKQNKILKYGPFGKNHATCATFAFKRSYFNDNKFPHVNKAEEKVREMCKKLLVNLIIEDYKIHKL